MSRQQRKDAFHALVRQIESTPSEFSGWHMLELAHIALTVAEERVQKEHGTRLPHTDAGIALMRDAKRHTSRAQNFLYYWDTPKQDLLLRRVVSRES